MSQNLVRLKADIYACSAVEEQKMVRLYQDYLKGLIGGSQVIWLALYRGNSGRKFWYTEAMNDWKIADMIFPGGSNIDVADACRKFYKKARENENFGPQFKLSLKTTGKTRVLTLNDATSRKKWDDHWVAKILAKYGVSERMVGAYTLSNSAESYFLIDRSFGDREFDEEDRLKLHEALVTFPRLHDWLFLNRGLVEPAKKPLSPRECEVLRALLGPNSEKAIASTLNLTRGTLNNYITKIYKNYQVHSRFELIQLWFRKLKPPLEN